MTSERTKMMKRRSGGGGRPATTQPSSSRAYRFIAATSLSLAFLDPSRLLHAQAYISTGLPAHVHRAYLRKLTDDICNTDPGTLTTQEVSNTAMLMSAWASAPKKLRESGKERAMKVENLLKRIIDERRAGNVEAIARTEDYNTVMKTWASSGEKSAAAFRVEQVSL
jgi:hypothetical protein